MENHTKINITSKKNPSIKKQIKFKMKIVYCATAIFLSIPSCGIKLFEVYEIGIFRMMEIIGILAILDYRSTFIRFKTFK